MANRNFHCQHRVPIGGTRSNCPFWGTSVVVSLVVIVFVSCPGCARKPTTNLGKAELAISEGNYTDALQLCDQELQFRADNADALVMRGRALVMLERWDEAVEAFSQAIELRPDDYDSLYRRENVYRKLGLDDLAMQDQELAKSLDPTYQTAYPYEPGTFIHRPPLPETAKSTSTVTERDSKQKEPGSHDTATDNEQEDDQSQRDASRRPGSRARSGQDSETAGTRGNTDRVTDRSQKEQLGKNTKDAGPSVAGSRPGGSRGEHDSLSDQKRKGIAPLAAEPLDTPSQPWKTEPEEPEFAPVPPRPPISTALPVPRGELDLTQPSDRMMALPSLPTTGLQPHVRSTSPLGLPNTTQHVPFSTGLPVQHPSLPSGTGVLPGGGHAPMTTGIQRPTVPSGPLAPGGGYSPIPGTATGPMSDYLRRLNPSSPLPSTGNPPPSTSLPGTALPSPSGVISTAIPGSEIPSPTQQKSKPISTALPESTSPPR